VARPRASLNSDKQGRPAARTERGAHSRWAQSTPMEFDRLIHEQIRLGIVSALAVNDTLSFSELKRLLDATDGNLSVHARKLEEAGYVSCLKYFAGRTPKTEYKLTPAGRRALETYLDRMESLIQSTKKSEIRN